MSRTTNEFPPPSTSDGLYVVDAYTNDHYAGVISPDLYNEYMSGTKRVTPTPRSVAIGNVAPVLARYYTVYDPNTNENTTTWYPVDATKLPPGPIAGEFKMVHLVNEV